MHLLHILSKACHRNVSRLTRQFLQWNWKYYNVLQVQFPIKMTVKPHLSGLYFPHHLVTFIVHCTIWGLMYPDLSLYPDFKLGQRSEVRFHNNYSMVHSLFSSSLLSYWLVPLATITVFDSIPWVPQMTFNRAFLLQKQVMLIYSYNYSYVAHGDVNALRKSKGF